MTYFLVRNMLNGKWHMGRGKWTEHQQGAKPYKKRGHANGAISFHVPTKYRSHYEVVQVEAAKELVNKAEFDFLYWFYGAADFGPADSDVRARLNLRYTAETGKPVPEGYRNEE